MSGDLGCRLFVLTARASRKAVIFRRGPSRQVAVISWDLARDTFTVGQWFTGRIYERRCDLSPDGEMLVYFAAGWRRQPFTWTAISRPPFLTALAMWPKGDAWGGGGLFESRTRLALNHPPGQSALSDGFTLPQGFTAVPFGDTPGRGEDQPVSRARDRRDGWRIVQEAEWGKPRLGADYFVAPAAGREEIWVKPQTPDGTGAVAIRRTLDGIGEAGGAWYALRHALVDEATGTAVDLGRTDWADWDGGDLVFARTGRLYRLDAEGVRRSAIDESVEIADFNDLRITPKDPPPESLRWPPGLDEAP